MLFITLSILIPALLLPARADSEGSVSQDTHGPIITPVSPLPGAANVALNPHIEAAWEDDASAPSASGVEPRSGRMWIRDLSLDLPAVEMTVLTARTDSGITFDAPLLRPCAIHEVVVRVSDKAGNAAEDARWLFRTTGCP